LCSLCADQLSPAFEDFLKFLGDKITLKGFEGFKGGLDVKRTASPSIPVLVPVA
jgi:hypothetical protein